MKLSKKSLVSIIILFVIVIIAITSIIIYNNKIIFKYSYENNAFSYINTGYYIYSNGTIKEFDKYNTKNKELKSAKISKEELTKLKELANIIEDNFKYDNSGIYLYDSGEYTVQIYSNRLFKWVKLSIWGESKGENSDQTSQIILDFTKQLYLKYINTPSSNYFVN